MSYDEQSFSSQEPVNGTPFFLDFLHPFSSNEQHLVMRDRIFEHSEDEMQDPSDSEYMKEEDDMYFKPDSVFYEDAKFDIELPGTSDDFDDEDQPELESSYEWISGPTAPFGVQIGLANNIQFQIEDNRDRVNLPEVEPLSTEHGHPQDYFQGANQIQAPGQFSPAQLPQVGDKSIDIEPTQEDIEPASQREMKQESQSSVQEDEFFFIRPPKFKIEVSKEVQQARDATIYGNEKDTVNIGTNVHTLLKRFLTELQKIPGELNQAQKKHIKAFIKSSPSYKTTDKFRKPDPKLDNLLKKCRQMSSSPEFIRRIQKNRCKMRNKLQLLMKVDVVRANFMDPTKLYRWKRDFIELIT